MHDSQIHGEYLTRLTYLSFPKLLHDRNFLSTAQLFCLDVPIPITQWY